MENHKNSFDNLLGDMGIGSSSHAKEHTNDIVVAFVPLDEEKIMQKVVDGSIKNLIEQYSADVQDRLKAIVVEYVSGYSDSVQDACFRYVGIEKSQISNYQSLISAVKGYVHSSPGLYKMYKENDILGIQKHIQEVLLNKKMADYFPSQAVLFMVQVQKMVESSS